MKRLNDTIRFTVFFAVIAASAVFVIRPAAPLCAQETTAGQGTAAPKESAPTTVSLKSPNRRMGLISSLVVQLLAKEHYTRRQMDAAYSGEVLLNSLAYQVMPPTTLVTVIFVPGHEPLSKPLSSQA